MSALVSSRELIDYLDRRDHPGEDEHWVIVDCRFDLDRTEQGQTAYVDGHIPGAVYAHLERDLSSSPVTDSGRHPLPAPEAMREVFESLGIGDGSRVVVYDDSNGMYAARLWWMLRYMGHDAVAVLDGGLADYLHAGGRLEAGIEHNARGRFTGTPRAGWLVVKSEVAAAARLFDARDYERYKGENESRDPRDGHIPGARSYPWRGNIGGDGRFLPPEVIRERMAGALEGVRPEDAVFYCGSGVSACVDVLAANLAGLDCRRVYVGSWSEWSRDETKPVAVGEE